MSGNGSSLSAEEDSSDREARDAEEEFRETCSRAVVSLCARHHYDMLLDKGHTKRSASSINGHLASRVSGQPWATVRDHILNLVPVALQDTLPEEIDLMGANWDTPLLPNDAFILRRSVQDELPEQAKGIQYAKECLTAHLVGQGDDTGRVAETIIRRTEHMRVNAAYEYLMRSVPVELRITYIAWLARRS